MHSQAEDQVERRDITDGRLLVFVPSITAAIGRIIHAGDQEGARPNREGKFLVTTVT